MPLISKQAKPIKGRIRLKGTRVPSSGSEDACFDRDNCIKPHPSEFASIQSPSESPTNIEQWPLRPRGRTWRGLPNAFSGWATLGPKVVVNDDTSCYLVNYHIFNDNHTETNEGSKGKLNIAGGNDEEEKANSQERLNHHTKHEITGEINEKRGLSKLRACSGKGYRSIGKSGSMSKAFGLDTHVTADWALCDVLTEQSDFEQVTPKPKRRSPLPFQDITTPVPGRMVYTVGRTSGFKYARIGQVPAVVKRESKGTTMEWFLENIDSVSTEEE